MKLAVFGLIISLGALTITGCKKKGGLFCYKSNGEIKTETRSVSGFNQIELSTSADIKIFQGTNYSLELSGSENILPIIKTKVNGDRLEIKLKNNKCLKGDGDINLEITMPELRGVKISGSGNVLIPNKMITSNLDIAISGSGNVRADSLYNDELSVSISGAGDVELQSLDTSAYNEIKVSGSGSVDLFGMPAFKSYVKISGSGDCDVNVLDDLDVKISGSGNVRYMGTPSVNQSTSGSGSVNPF